MSCVEHEEFLAKKPKLDEDEPIFAPIEESEEISPPSGKSSISEDSSSDDDFQDEPEPDYFAIDAMEPVLGYMGPNVYRCNPADPEDMMLRNACTDHVIAEYNRLMDSSKSQLRLVKIENATRHRFLNYLYYITFDAFDTVTQQNATYQTEIFCPVKNDEKWIHFIRKKGQKQEIFFPIDLSDQEEFNYNMVVKGARKMIDLHNDEQTHLQLKKVLKAVGNANVCRKVLVSFEAEDTMTKQVKTYFAGMYYALSDNTVGVGGLLAKDDDKARERFAALVEDE